MAAQPEQVAYSIIDSRSIDLFMPSVYPPESADTLEGLAQKLGIPGGSMARTVRAFNDACAEGPFSPQELDGLSTAGIEPPKTNWARPIAEPPFYGYVLRPGVTFTYLGLKVDETARVTGPEGRYDNIWTAGEMMAGSILGRATCGLRHDHRHRLRPHRRPRGRRPCRAPGGRRPCHLTFRF